MAGRPDAPWYLGPSVASSGGWKSFVQGRAPSRPARAPTLRFPALVLTLALSALLPASAAAEHSVRELLSGGPAGTSTEAPVSFETASADGTRVVSSTAESLVPGDRDDTSDVYVRSRRVTELVSLGEDGSGNATFAARFAGASANADRIFFDTEESLTTEDTDQQFDLYERFEGRTTLISARGDAVAGAPTPATYAGASQDGARVFFTTAEQLTSTDGDAEVDVYERSGRQTRLVSERRSEPPPGSVSSDVTFAGASGDGTRVFLATADQLDPTLDTDAERDVYERSAGQTTLVSQPTAPSGSGSADVSFAGASGDGTRVFLETAEQLDPAADTDSDFDVYERTGLTETRLVSAGDGGRGNLALPASFEGASDDGTRVLFTTSEPLNGEDGGTAQDVYERSSGATTLVSPGGVGGPDATLATGTDGRAVFAGRVFFETAEPLVPEDRDPATDVYQRSGGQTTLVSVGGASADSARFEDASDDGARVFLRTAERLADADGDSSVDVYERVGGRTSLISAGGSGPFDADLVGVSNDGVRVVLSTQEALAGGDPDAATDLYAVRIPFPVDTTIGSGPSGTTSDDTPTFTVAAAEPGNELECRVDEAPFAACSVEVTTQPLGDGPHVFEARTVNFEGDPDPTPAARAFTIDTQAPETTITGGPSGVSHNTTPRFLFASSEPGSTFRCRTNRGIQTPCSSPLGGVQLGDSRFTFEVVAVDAAGNVDSTPASRSFTIDTRAPSITGARLSPEKFAARRRGRSRTPLGTLIRFVLDEPARVTIGIERARPGRRVGGRCAAPSRANRRRRACTRFLAQGSLNPLGLGSGRRSARLTGLLRGRALATGAYRAVIVAKDVAGNASRPVRLGFTVLGR